MDNLCAKCMKPLEGEAPSIEEYEQHFGKFRPEDVDVICDDCWSVMHPEKHPHLVEESIKKQKEIPDA